MTVLWRGEPIFISPEDERRSVGIVHHLLITTPEGAVSGEVRMKDGRRATVPPSVIRLISAASAQLRHGEAVQVHSVPAMMTVDEAAEMLREDVGVVRMRLLDGELPAREVKGERVQLTDAVSYLQRRRLNK